MKILLNTKKFLIEIANEKNIPKQDKYLLLFFLLASLLPIILIPEWTESIYGLFISLILISFNFDYFFNILDTNLILQHYPFGLKSFSSIKRFGQFLSILAPSFITQFIWKYEKPIF